MAAGAAATLALCAGSAGAQVVRSDAMVAGPPGIAIFVREIVGRAPAPNVAPLLLVHDTPAAGSASFDLGVPGGSLAADLAESGLRVYLMDARGYGRSSRAPRLASPPRPEGGTEGAVRQGPVRVRSLRVAQEGPVPTEETWRIVERWVETASDAGERFGLIDLLIAALTHEMTGLVWSLDRDFERMATLGLVQSYQ